MKPVDSLGRDGCSARSRFRRPAASRAPGLLRWPVASGLLPAAALVLAMPVLVHCASGAPASRPDARPAQAPATPFTAAPLKLPPLAEHKLDNGLSVVTVEKRDLPLVAVRLVLPAGSGRDPKGKEGLASFTAQLLRRGTATRTAEQIDDAIESIGGLLSVEAGAEATALAVTVPSENLGAALTVLADLAHNASFPVPEVELARRRELSQLQHDLDDPSSVADKALVQFVYGKDHPFGHPVEGRTESVKTFVRPDVAGFRDAYYSPDGALLLLVGDVDSKALEAARAAFGAWKGPTVTPLQASAPARPQGLEILLVDKADATQAQVRASVPGLPRRDPGYYAAVVANTVVGGGFTSRLVDEVRVNRGLSYSVGTRVVALRDTGAISFSTFTKTETVREILDVSFQVMGAFAEKGPTADEVDKGRRYVAGLYPSRVESIDQLAEALGAARVAGLPFDTVEKYRPEIARVTPEDAARLARLWPTAGSAKVVVVGLARQIRPQLEGLGKVTSARTEDYE